MARAGINERLDRENKVRTASFANLPQLARAPANGNGTARDAADLAVINLQRADSTFARRVGASGQRGPLVVQGNFEKGAGASTVVTRSIGDWDASRAVIPEPEVETWAIPPYGARPAPGATVYDRVIMASDGLWDLVSPQSAERMVRRVRDPTAAAAKLLRAATRESKANGYGATAASPPLPLVSFVRLTRAPSQSA